MSDTKQELDPTRWLDDYGDLLFRYALYRVRRNEVAEDIVQETLLAAMKAKDKFAGRSSEKTWLMSILKNKIADHFRKSGREKNFSEVSENMGLDDSESFNEFGGWATDHVPRHWSTNPERAAESNEAGNAIVSCIDKLPPRVGELLKLRELDGQSTEDLCRDYELSKSNLWVILHRGRHALRECLESSYYTNE